MNTTIQRTIARGWVIALLLWAQALSAATCLGDSSARSQSVYVVPQLAAAHLYAHWAPFLQQLGQRTGSCFELMIPKNIPDFEAALIKGLPDFAFMNPYHQVMAYRAQKYVPLVADGQNKLDGLLVVRKDSTIRSIKELHDARIAFPAPNAFAASLVIRATLAHDDVAITPLYVKSHENVYRAVIMGDALAGGGVNNTLEREPQEVREQLRVLMRTPFYMPHPFSAHPRISAAEQTRIAEAMVQMGSDEQLKPLLYEIQINQPVKVNYQRDYQPLDQLGLGKFVVQ